MKTAKEWMKIQESIEVPESESEERALKRIENFIEKIQLDTLNEAAILVRANEKHHETDYSNSNVLIDLIEKLGGTASIVR